MAPLLAEAAEAPLEKMQVRADECEALIQKGQAQAELFQKKVQALPQAFRKEAEKVKQGKDGNEMPVAELDALMADHQKRLVLRIWVMVENHITFILL